MPMMLRDACALAEREYASWRAEKGAKRRFRTPQCHKLFFDAVAMAEQQLEASGVKVMRSRWVALVPLTPLVPPSRRASLLRQLLPATST